MAGDLATLRISIGAEVAGLQSELRRAEQSIVQLNARLVGLGRNSSGAGALQQQIAQISQQANNLRTRLGEFNLDSPLNRASAAAGVFSSELQDVIGQAVGIASIGGAFIGVGAAVTKSVQSFADVERQIVRFSALNDLNAASTAKFSSQLDDLSNRFTQFSKVDLAASLVEISKAGVSAADAVNLLPTAINFAIAAEEGLQTASEKLIGITNGFGLGLENAAHTADVLAQAAKDSAVGVSDIALTMSYVAPVAQQAGQSLEEMGAITALLGNNLIKGERAGTALRGILVRLIDPPKEARDALAALGVSIQDVNGKMLPLSDIIQQVREKTAGLTEAQRNQRISQIAGTEALSAFSILLKAQPGQLEAATQKYNELIGTNDALAQSMQKGLTPAFIAFQNVLLTSAANAGKAIADFLGLAEALRAVTAALQAVNSGNFAGALRAGTNAVAFSRAQKLADQGAIVGSKLDGTPIYKKGFVNLNPLNQLSSGAVRNAVSDFQSANAEKNQFNAITRFADRFKPTTLKAPIQRGAAVTAEPGKEKKKKGASGEGEENSIERAERAIELSKVQQEFLKKINEAKAQGAAIDERILALQKEANNNSLDLARQKNAISAKQSDLDNAEKQLALEEAQRSKTDLTQRQKQETKEQIALKRQAIADQRAELELQQTGLDFQKRLSEAIEAKQIAEQNYQKTLTLSVAPLQLELDAVNAKISKEQEQINLLTKKGEKTSIIKKIEEELEKNKEKQITLEGNLNKARTDALTPLNAALEAFRNTNNEINNGLEAAKKRFESVLEGNKTQKEIDSLRDKVNLNFESIKSAGQSLSSTLTNAFKSFVTTGKLDIKSLTNSILSQFIDLGIQLAIINPLKNLLAGNSSGSGGGGGILPGLLSGLGSKIAGFFGGAFAEGGEPPLGKISLVGERGPELFVPKRSGTIIPNSGLEKFAGGSGGAPQATTINMTFTVVANDTAGFDALLAKRKNFIQSAAIEAVGAVRNKRFQDF